MRIPRSATHRWVWLAGAMFAGAIALPSAPIHASDGSDSAWVATWGTPLMPPGSAFAPSRSFENQTIRHIVHVSVGGRRVRVRLANPFRATVFDQSPPAPYLSVPPLVIGAVHVALHNSDASIVPFSDRALRFSGSASVTLPPGGVVLSDPVDLDVPSLANLAVSVFLPFATGPASYTEVSTRTSYIAGPGDLTDAMDLPGAEETLSRYFLSGVEVLPRDPVGVVVAFGDSITLGGDSTVDQDRSWPDVLSARLNAGSDRPRAGVVNQGVGCGRLMWDFCGQNGSARFDRDVLTITGVTHAIVALGLNDLGLPGAFSCCFDLAHQVPSAEDVMRGLHQLIERAHARRIKVFGATITPIGSSTVPGFFTPEFEAKRQAVNNWIRTSGAFDAVIDFDRVVRDPARPERLRADYNSGNGIHLSDKGYTAMANAINLSLFR